MLFICQCLPASQVVLNLKAYLGQAIDNLQHSSNFEKWQLLELLPTSSRTCNLATSESAFCNLMENTTKKHMQMYV